MAIQETAVSYYGLGYVEHAAADFEEIRAHHCTTVILAVTEFEFDFWRPNLPAVVAAARRAGLPPAGTLKSKTAAPKAGTAAAYFFLLPVGFLGRFLRTE